MYFIFVEIDGTQGDEAQKIKTPELIFFFFLSKMVQSLAAISRIFVLWLKRMTLLLFNQRTHMFDEPTCGLAEGELTQWYSRHHSH